MTKPKISEIKIHELTEKYLHCSDKLPEDAIACLKEILKELTNYESNDFTRLLHTACRELVLAIIASNK